MLHEKAAKQWTGDRGDSENRPEVALVAAALAGRDDIADDGERQRHEATGAEPLNCPGTDELPHLRRQAGQSRADEEHDDGEAEHRLAAVEVGDLAVQRGGRRRRQQVGGHNPGQVLEPAQITNDRRQRRGHDGLVECG